MHIPDGYLSPSTCATFYLFAATGWYAGSSASSGFLPTRDPADLGVRSILVLSS